MLWLWKKWVLLCWVAAVAVRVWIESELPPSVLSMGVGFVAVQRPQKMVEGCVGCVREGSVGSVMVAWEALWVVSVGVEG